MNDLATTGNLAEAALWGSVSLIFAVATCRTVGVLRRIYGLWAVCYFFFGVSDLIESQTGAWWRPWWLLLLKAACVAGFAYGLREYFRLKKLKKKTN